MNIGKIIFNRIFNKFKKEEKVTQKYLIYYHEFADTPFGKEYKTMYTAFYEEKDGWVKHLTLDSNKHPYSSNFTIERSERFYDFYNKKPNEVK